MTDTLIDPQDCWTRREIVQQPQTLVATQAVVRAGAAALSAFLTPLLADRATRIVLTGAGTSAFIGECLAPVLSRHLGRVVEAIATTDLVSAPDLYLRRDEPLLLVSFGRSGNSPESLAAIELADARVTRAHHLIVTCNADGTMAHRDGAHDLVLRLPEATHDRGFAMTSSFSAMMLAAWSALTGVAPVDASIARIAAAVAATVDVADLAMRRLAGCGFDRVVYLGSGPFKGLAREAALKLMELSDGAVVTAFDTPMGFRHGPKTIVTPRTLVMVFLSNDPLTARYDHDLVEELRGDAIAGAMVTIAARAGPATDIVVAGMEDAPDVELLFPFIAPAQLFGLHVSEALGLTPDRPNASGTVNRVVRGVRLHAG